MAWIGMMNGDTYSVKPGCIEFPARLCNFVFIGFHRAYLQVAFPGHGQSEVSFFATEVYAKTGLDAMPQDFPGCLFVIYRIFFITVCRIIVRFIAY